MIVIPPKSRPRPYLTPLTHARLKHDYATWHPEHVEQTERYQGRTLPFVRKSKFDSAQFISEAVVRSYDHNATLAKNGNHVIVFDFGHTVGWDEIAKRQTSSVTVVVRPTGEVITAHPGTPWSKDQSES